MLPSVSEICTVWAAVSVRDGLTYYYFLCVAMPLRVHVQVCLGQNPTSPTACYGHVVR